MTRFASDPQNARATIDYPEHSVFPLNLNQRTHILLSILQFGTSLVSTSSRVLDYQLIFPSYHIDDLHIGLVRAGGHEVGLVIMRHRVRNSSRTCRVQERRDMYTYVYYRSRLAPNCQHFRRTDVGHGWCLIGPEGERAYRFR